MAIVYDEFFFPRPIESGDMGSVDQVHTSSSDVERFDDGEGGFSGEGFGVLSIGIFCDPEN